LGYDFAEFCIDIEKHLFVITHGNLY